MGSTGTDSVKTDVDSFAQIPLTQLTQHSASAMKADRPCFCFNDNKTTSSLQRLVMNHIWCSLPNKKRLRVVLYVKRFGIHLSLGNGIPINEYAVL